MSPEQREAMLLEALPEELRDSGFHRDLIANLMDGLASRGFSISLASVRDHTNCDVCDGSGWWTVHTRVGDVPVQCVGGGSPVVWSVEER